MVEIRVLESDEHLREAANVFRTAMVGLPSPPASFHDAIPQMREPGRVLGAFVDDRLVGTTESAAGRMTLPGGARVAHSPVTRVGVLPEFTRRGVVSSLLTRQLEDLRERGDVVASLRASEAVIYGRFGYGVASRSARVELATARAGLHHTLAASGPVRLVPVPESWDLVRRIVTEHPSPRPGHISRPDGWWRSVELVSEANTQPKYVAVHGETGAEDGFVRYHPIGTDQWFGGDRRTVVVDDLHAPTTQAYVGLLRFLLRLDLVDAIVFASMPVDDALQTLLVDRRAARVTSTADETWLRILDVEKALAARTYSGDRSVTVAVTDEVLPGNDGVYRISREGVTRSGDDADVRIGVRDLATVLLGQPGWRQLGAAGLAHGTPDALDAADELFTSRLAPHAGVDF